MGLARCQQMTSILDIQRTEPGRDRDPDIRKKYEAWLSLCLECRMGARLRHAIEHAISVGNADYWKSFRVYMPDGKLNSRPLGYPSGAVKQSNRMHRLKTLLS